jgi:FO synthase
MNETITRSAGATHGQEMAPDLMEETIRAAGRRTMQRTTLYGAVPAERQHISFAAAPLMDIVNTPARAYQRA